MSDSVQPHRWQPTRLSRPWNSPGKNNGVGCHFLLQCMKVKSEREVSQSCPTLRDPMDCSLPGSSVHGILQARVLEWGAIGLYQICVLQTFSPSVQLIFIFLTISFTEIFNFNKVQLVSFFFYLLVLCLKNSLPKPRSSRFLLCDCVL